MNDTIEEAAPIISIDDLAQFEDMAGLADWVTGCKACSLRESATQPVLYAGDPASLVAIVGINPDFASDATGIPFTGRTELMGSRCISCSNFETCYEWQMGAGTAARPRVERCLGHTPRLTRDVPLIPKAAMIGRLKIAGIKTVGQVLDDLLDAIGIKREKIYLTNAALCKSVAGASPKPQEYNRCSSIRIRAQRLVKPKVIITLGNDATQQYSGKKLNLKTSHGLAFKATDSQINFTVVPTYHPSTILMQMLSTGHADLASLETIKLSVLDAKLAMYADFVTAFNLLSEEELLPFIVDPAKLVAGKLPIRLK